MKDCMLTPGSLDWGGQRDTKEGLTNSGRVEGSGLKTITRQKRADPVLM